MKNKQKSKIDKNIYLYTYLSKIMYNFNKKI